MPDLLSPDRTPHIEAFNDESVLHEVGVQWLHFGGTSAGY